MNKNNEDNKISPDMIEMSSDTPFTPFPSLDSLLVTATILSYYGVSGQCRELVNQLSKRSHKYAKEKKDTLIGFIKRDF